MSVTRNRSENRIKNTSDRHGNNARAAMMAVCSQPMRIEDVIRNPRGLNAVTRRYRQACGIGKNLNIIRFFRFKMRAKFTVADESSRKFSVLCESVVSVAIRCILMRFSERFRVTLVADQT